MSGTVKPVSDATKAACKCDLQLTLLLAYKEPEKYDGASARLRLVQQSAGVVPLEGRHAPAEEEGRMAHVATADVTLAAIDEMEPIHGGLVRRARATLEVSAWGMQVLTLPPNWDGYPDHNHDAEAFDPDQEEVYIPLQGSGALVAGDETFDLVVGTMVRIGPEQHRRILPGPEGIRFVALGGRPGAFDAPSWTELGAPPPRAE